MQVSKDPIHALYTLLSYFKGSGDTRPAVTPRSPPLVVHSMECGGPAARSLGSSQGGPRPEGAPGEARGGRMRLTNFKDQMNHKIGVILITYDTPNKIYQP